MGFHAKFVSNDLDELEYPHISKVWLSLILRGAYSRHQDRSFEEVYSICMVLVAIPKCSMVLVYLSTFIPKMPKNEGKYSIEHLGLVLISTFCLIHVQKQDRKGTFS